MIGLSILDYPMRRPPMATNVRVTDDFIAAQTFFPRPDPMSEKILQLINGLAKFNVVQVSMQSTPTGVPVYYVTRNFKGAIGTLYANDLKRINFETFAIYEYETGVETGLFGRKRLEKRQGTAFLTGIVPYDFGFLNVELKRNMLIFTPAFEKLYRDRPAVPAEKIGERFVFELESPTSFIKDLVTWAMKRYYELPTLVEAEEEELSPEVRELKYFIAQKREEG